MAKCEVYGNACHLSFCRWASCARRQGVHQVVDHAQPVTRSMEGIGHLLVEALPPCLLLSIRRNALEKVRDHHRMKAFQLLQS
jgi:hypothetical protein